MKPVNIYRRGNDWVVKYGVQRSVTQCHKEKKKPKVLWETVGFDLSITNEEVRAAMESLMKIWAKT